MSLYLRIKNWCKFQHYKSGPHAEKKPEWIKLYRALLDDIEWYQLDPVAAKTLVSLWLLASENGGTLPDLKTIAFRLRMPEKQIKSVLSQLPHWIDDGIDNVYTASIPEEEREKEEREEEGDGAKAPARAHQLPPGWLPSESHFLEGERLGFSAREVEDMAEDMRLWAGAKGEAKKNWGMAFSGWIRREKKNPKRGAGPPQKESHFRSVVQKFIEEKDSGNIVDFEGATGRRAICSSGGGDNLSAVQSAAARSENGPRILDASAVRVAEIDGDSDG
jgi:hypothetical protein